MALPQSLTKPVGTAGDNMSSTPSLFPEPDTDAVYREAVDFIRLTEQLKESPKELSAVQRQLEVACSELAASAECLRSRMNNLTALTSDGSAVR